MNFIRRLNVGLLRLRSLFGKSALETQLQRELRFHLDQQTEENIARGMPPGEARHAAMRSLGGVAQIQEECRDMRGTQTLETIWNDLRYAARMLIRTPGFAIIIVLSLGLSIGANSAIFSVIEGVLLRPLPYPQPDRLVRLYFNSDAQPKFPLNPNDFLDFRSRNRTFAGMAAITRHDVQLSGTGQPVMLRAFNVSAGYFKVLGFTPARGRDFSTTDELPEHGRLAILSDHLWRSRFGGDGGIVGRTITLDGQSMTVIGIMPPGTRHPGNNFHAVNDGDTVDLWMPHTFDDDPNYRAAHFMDGIGRLKTGISAEQGQADLLAVLAQLKLEHPGERGWRVYLVPLYQETVGSSKRMLLVLLAAVGLLLLIACVNAANLLLARSSARVREMAVRSALGAARGRIVRQLLTESLMIALAGGGLGTLLAFGGVLALGAALPPAFPRATEIHLDAGVFAVTLLVAVATGFVFGLIPALTASKTDLQQSLREGGRGTTGGGRQLRLRNFLVAGETALACVLLIAAGLMLHSFVNLLRSDPGFQPAQVLTASLSLPYERYKDVPQRMHFFEQLVARLEAVPGVDSAGLGTDLPWTGYDGNADGFRVEGRSLAYNEKTTGRYHIASPDYFRAMGIPLLRGRFFDGHDDQNAPLVLIVNESMAKRYWPGENAIGKRITFRGDPAEKDWIQIAGVVRDVKDQPDSSSVRPGFWLPLEQEPSRTMSVAVRSGLDAAVLSTQLRDVVRQLDPQLAIADLRLMSQVSDEAFSSHRFALFLVGLFSALALTLAAIGMYGVVSYSVNQRMPEFGIRMALGARPGDLMRLIVGHGLKLTVLGAAAGLLIAVSATRLLGSLLYGVSGEDPLTFACVAVLALVTALVACYLPARRASGADMLSLRAE